LKYGWVTSSTRIAMDRPWMFEKVNMKTSLWPLSNLKKIKLTERIVITLLAWLIFQLRYPIPPRSSSRTTCASRQRIRLIWLLSALFFDFASESCWGGGKR